MNSSAQESYQKLLAHAHELGLLANAVNLLQWDEDTCLPTQGTAYRAEQLSHLAGMVHRRATVPVVGEWLHNCEEGGLLHHVNAGPNIREWRRDYDRQVKLPSRLVEEITLQASLARAAWIEARKLSDFALFQPKLARMVDLCREKADAWATCPQRYDTLLDAYEPGARVAQLVPLFDYLRARTAEVMPRAAEKTGRLPASRLLGHYPIETQKTFNQQVAQKIGFDFSAGRIDSSHHPFCASPGPRDIRITTRYDERDFTSSLFAIMHESGHAMYEQGLSPEFIDQPLSEPISLGIHESQSRLWENQVGRSAFFWENWYPQAQRHFPNLENLPLSDFLLLINQVRPSFIRVDADEVTYNLHIMLRFEIEQQLIEGTLPVADVAIAWRTRFEELFGLKIEKDAQGCLQDIHWCSGGFGYFPTYTLGTLNAAQFFHAATVQIPDLQAQLASGVYDGLRTWLNENVHRHGRRYSPTELMVQATGEPTNARYFCDYIEKKFLSDE